MLTPCRTAVVFDFLVNSIGKGNSRTAKCQLNIHRSSDGGLKVSSEVSGSQNCPIMPRFAFLKSYPTRWRMVSAMVIRHLSIHTALMKMYSRAIRGTSKILNSVLITVLKYQQHVDRRRLMSARAAAMYSRTRLFLTNRMASAPSSMTAARSSASYKI